ncbi:MAG: Alkyl hydroperoxide reductase subunit C-like protein [Candidatus Bipolaricaulis sibiricus]|uniref:Alkyl hydroperoxide reductase subunit C-like protein n=1 Tax=Bipolaricaulis sibiricus TaxID=2501609 RepID=A0A410FSD6_BIPS1|nr:MAG: Alkyl hydroperoxide reductase subunit C-like protein [Candidatus Bipolaricaulis sibiricus]
MVKVGDRAPAFSLVDTERRPVKLDDFAGKSVVLAFYPGAFTKVCQKELCAFRDMLANLEALNAQVLGISVDSPWANGAFAAANRIPFPLLSDYTRAVSRQYGGVHEDFAGLPGFSVSKRAVFVVDGGGVVRYAWVSDDPGVEPPYAEIEAALSATQR